MVQLKGWGGPVSLLQYKQQKRVYLVRDNNKDIFTAMETERAKIADVLQEEIAQLIAIAKMQLPGNDFCEVNTYLTTAVKKLRQLSFELKPQILEHFGLATALEQLLHQHTGSTVKIKDLPTNMDSVIESAIFRLLLQILNVMPESDFSDFDLDITRSGLFIQLQTSFETNHLTDLFTENSFKEKLSEAVQPLLFLFNGEEHLQFYPNQHVAFLISLDESILH